MTERGITQDQNTKNTTSPRQTPITHTTGSSSPISRLSDKPRKRSSRSLSREKDETSVKNVTNDTTKNSPTNRHKIQSKPVDDSLIKLSKSSPSKSKKSTRSSSTETNNSLQSKGQNLPSITEDQTQSSSSSTTSQLKFEQNTQSPIVSFNSRTINELKYVNV